MQQSVEKNKILSPHEIAKSLVSSCALFNIASTQSERTNSLTEMFSTYFFKDNKLEIRLIEDVILELKSACTELGADEVQIQGNRTSLVFSEITSNLIKRLKTLKDDGLIGSIIVDHFVKFNFNLGVGGKLERFPLQGMTMQQDEVEEYKQTIIPSNKSMKTRTLIKYGIIAALGMGLIGPNFDKLKGFSLKKINWPNPMGLFADKKQNPEPENDGWGKILNIPKQLTDNRIVTNLDEGAMLYDQLNNEYIFWGIGTKNKSGKKQRPIVTLQIALEQNKIKLPEDFDVAYIKGTKELDHKINAIRFAKLMRKDENLNSLIYRISGTH